MASRILHLSVGCELEKAIEIKDINRFRIGTILPDAMVTKSKMDYNTHFAKFTDAKEKKVMDFEEFFKGYESEITTDELYLGYYFHLIEDDIFRNMLYYDLDLIRYRGDEGFLEQLYKDYGVVGAELIEKYGLEDNLFPPENFENEKILRIAPFEITEFLNEMKNDFSVRKKDEPVYFTRKHSEVYIKRCSEVLIKEYDAIKNGRHTAFAKDYYWDNKQF